MFSRGKRTHLSDDETVAKMGHPPNAHTTPCDCMNGHLCTKFTLCLGYLRDRVKIGDYYFSGNLQGCGVEILAKMFDGRGAGD
jgi:hypothetical protein